MGLAAFGPTMMTMMANISPATHLGMMLSSPLMGPIIRRAGFTEGFLLAALINLILGASFYPLFRRFPPAGKIAS